MRSNLITVFTAVASVLLVAQVAAADQVQEQFRLVEQRMAEMEDRLQATSSELQSARATVQEQQALLTDAGLVDSADSGLRSGVGSFFEMVDISGVAAASYNHRLIKADDPNGGNDLFKYPNANTFQVDQIWVTIDKAPTEESRGGFHAEFATGASAQPQGSNNGTSTHTNNAGGQITGTNDRGTGVPYLYSGYVSYLAPVGNGVQVDLGRLATVLGAEVVQTNGNFNITQGAVFGLQPVTYDGVSLSTQITDEISLTAGVVNDVYSDTDVSADNNKAYFGQVGYARDTLGLNVGVIYGDSDEGFCQAPNGTQNDCTTSVVDVVLTLDPTDNISLWLNYDWVHVDGINQNGGGQSGNGNAHGVAGAGRIGITDTLGLATRLEYVNLSNQLGGPVTPNSKNTELFTVTGTLDKTLAEGLVTRLELRYDTYLDDNGSGFTLNGNASGTNDDQLVALWQMSYEF
jgi:hypothetical protein